MDYFALLMDSLCLLVGHGVMHMVFISRLTGKKLKKWYFAVYFLLLGMIQFLSDRLALDGTLPVAVGVLALYGLSRYGMGNQRSVSWLAAVLSYYISQLSFGIINSVEAALFPRFIGSPLFYLLFLAAQLLFFVLCAGCYYAVLKLLTWTEDNQMPYIGLLLFPGLFFFAAELYILHTAYSIFAPIISLEEVGRHSTLLLLQVMGLAALLCTLYAYRQLCKGFQAQAELQSLTQAAHEQKVYIAEAQARYEQTKSFRHDIKNHLSVLDGLLRGGKLEVLPKPCGIDDFDLCVLFANALDNAIAACRANDGAKAIRISGKQQGDFYMLTFENTCSDEPLPPAGTGLSNIKAVAEKYHGALLTEKNGRQFYLSVLLNISPCNS